MATLGATTILTPAAGHAGNQQVLSTDSKTNVDFSLSTTSSTEYTASRITITPTAATSRILIVYAIQGHINKLSLGTTRTAQAFIHSYIGTTDTNLGPIYGMRVMLEDNDYTDHSTVVSHIDHPDTTSAVRYSMHMTDTDSSIVYWQHAFAGTHGMRGYARELMGATNATEW